MMQVLQVIQTSKYLRCKRQSFLRIIHLLVEQLGHREHMHPIDLEYRSHSFVASDLSPVVRVLQVSSFDVVPDLFHGLWP